MKDQGKQYRSYTKLSELVTGVMEPVARRYNYVESQILLHWPTIAGKEAMSSIPVKVTGHQAGKATLHLQVQDGSSLVYQHMEPFMLEKIALYFGFKAIDKIKWIQCPLEKSEKKSIAKHNNTYTIKEAEGSLKDIDDPVLRGALRALGQDIALNNTDSEVEHE